MGGFLTLVEDRPTPKNVYNWRVYALAAVASFASCMIGYDSAFIGTTLALPSFEDEFGFENMTADHLAFVKSNIVSIYQAGAFFGSLAAYRTFLFDLQQRHADSLTTISFGFLLRTQEESPDLFESVYPWCRHDAGCHRSTRPCSHLRWPRHHRILRGRNVNGK